LSTAEKQSFFNLATAYGQRAVRLTALAAAAPAALVTPLDELAAYYFLESQTYAAIAADPADPNFTTVAPPQDLTVPPLGAGAGITQAVADQFNALFAEQGQALGLAEAISTALNRAQGAGDSPANAAYAELQLAAVTQFSQQLGALLPSEPRLLANVEAALQAGGVADVSVSPSDVAALQTQVAGAGLPGALVQALGQLQAGAGTLQAIQAQFEQADPEAAAGTLSATLTDPAFAALVHSNAQVLMGTVLLTGTLSPSSYSGASQSNAITNVATPQFVGTAPAGTLVQLYTTAAGGATAPQLIGQATADGSGQWQITASRLSDGTYTISAGFTPAGGGATQVTPLTQIVIDTVGPRITAASYNRKTGQVTLTFSGPMSLDAARLSNPAFYVARSGKGLLTVSKLQRVGASEVTFVVSKGRTHPTTITLDVVSGGIRDVVGNALDGEFRGTFPSGNGQVGGDFVSVLPVPVHKAKKPGKPARKPKA
jgi:hypothetical protein